MDDSKRQLNMEEKRRLERLIFSDIDAASSKHRSARHTGRADLEERLVAQAPSGVLDLVTASQKASKEVARIQKELEERGYALDGYGEKKLRLTYTGNKARELAEYDAETQKTQARLESLKRDYTLRLFAGGEEARELFVTLTSELAAMTSE